MWLLIPHVHIPFRNTQVSEYEPEISLSHASSSKMIKQDSFMRAWEWDRMPYRKRLITIARQAVQKGFNILSAMQALQL